MTNSKNSIIKQNIYRINQYIRNTWWLFLEYAFSLFTGLIVGIAVAKHIGAESYGILNFGLTLYAIALGISSLGIDDIIIRDSINKAEDKNKVFGTAFICKSTAIIICIATFCLYAYFVSNKENFIIISIIILSLFFQCFNILVQDFQINLENKYVALARIFGFGISSVIKIILIIISAPLIYFAISIALSSLFYIIFLMYFYIKKGNSFKGWYFDISYFNYLVKKCYPFFILIVSHTIYLKLTSIMIQYSLGEKPLGEYSAALKLTEVWYAIPSILIAVIFPDLVSMKNKSDNDFYKGVLNILSITILPFIIFSIFVSIYSKTIVYIIFGEEYQAAASILSIIIWSLPLFMLYAVTIKYFTTEHKPFSAMIRSLSAVIILVISSYILFNLYGINGYAYGFIISFFISYFLIDILFKNSYKLFFIKIKSLYYPFIVIFRYIYSKKYYKSE